MKGILKLIPIKKPVEGMQVVIYNQIAKIKSIFDIYHCTLDPEIASLAYLSALKQIVIEYNIYDGDGDDKIGVDTLPLHPEDWKTALPLIGKEVEFETFNISQGVGLTGKPLVQVAKLILPKQEERIYTRQDMENAYKEGCRVASPFGDQGLSKYEKQHWPTWIENYITHQ